MPTFSADGQWIYFIRIRRGRGKFPTGGFQSRSWYDLDDARAHPDEARRIRRASGSSPARYVRAARPGSTGCASPSRARTARRSRSISDGPNPLQSDIVLHPFAIASKKLTSLNLPESLHLGHQDPAWRPDGKYLLYVKNGRELTRGAPQIFRYEPATKKTRGADRARLHRPGVLAGRARGSRRRRPTRSGPTSRSSTTPARRSSGSPTTPTPSRRSGRRPGTRSRSSTSRARSSTSGWRSSTRRPGAGP